MKHTRFALIALPLLLAAGCQRSPVPTQTNNEQQATGSSSLTAPSIMTTSFADKWTDKDIDRCLYSITYPELTRPSIWMQKEPLRDTDVDAANREILKAYGLLSATGTIALNPKEVAREFIDLCKSDLKNMASQLGPESIENINYINDSTFTTHLLTPTIVSFEINTYEYTGGVHGNTGIRAITLDLATGKRLTLGNVIKNDQLQSVMKLAYADILTNNEEELFEEARNEINTVINNKSIMTVEEQNKKFGSATDFFLTGEGLILFWNAYEIAPYAAGQPEAFIPWSELNGKLLINRP